MPKVMDAARLSAPAGAVLAECDRCGSVVALTSGATCDRCVIDSRTVSFRGLEFTAGELSEAYACLDAVCDHDPDVNRWLSIARVYLAAFLGEAACMVCAGDEHVPLRAGAAMFVVLDAVNSVAARSWS